MGSHVDSVFALNPYKRYVNEILLITEDKKYLPLFAS